jgi:GxxExxY protein
LAFELKRRGLVVERQVCVPVIYDGVQLDAAFRIDILVNKCVLIELKAVEKMIPLYDAQVLTSLKLTGLRLGILINFNSKLIKDGMKRIVL